MFCITATDTIMWRLFTCLSRETGTYARVSRKATHYSFWSCLSPQALKRCFQARPTVSCKRKKRVHRVAFLHLTYINVSLFEVNTNLHHLAPFCLFDCLMSGFALTVKIKWLDLKCFPLSLPSNFCHEFLYFRCLLPCWQLPSVAIFLLPERLASKSLLCPHQLSLRMGAPRVELFQHIPLFPSMFTLSQTICYLEQDCLPVAQKPSQNELKQPHIPPP